jgi:TPR repeat protein
MTSRDGFLSGVSKMARLTKFRNLALVTVLFAGSFQFSVFSVKANSFEDGLAALHKGDYKTALDLWKPLADAGDSHAKYNLGLMYENGLGVTQDKFLT